MTAGSLFHYTKWFLALAAACCTAASSFGQYYYKDIVTTQQVNHTYLVFRNNKVIEVKLTSFQGERPVTDGFVCEQKVARNQVVTYTKTADAGESFFTASYNGKGLLVKTADSSAETISTSQYQYDAEDRLLQIINETHARDRSSQTTEIHTWQYNAAGKPAKMFRIRNGKDTLAVVFRLDDKMNVSEETIVKGATPETIYYYYDGQNRITDIVRYNMKAKRLLPDYIFEYEENGELATMLVVPEGSSEYLKWYYKYDDAGLKAVEFCYDKKKVLQGKIEYSYNGNSR